MNDSSETNGAGAAPGAHAAQKCARCGAPFRCGACAGDQVCWCAGFSALPLERLRAGEGCLCPACLAAEIARIGHPD